MSRCIMHTVCMPPHSQSDKHHLDFRTTSEHPSGEIYSAEKDKDKSQLPLCVDSVMMCYGPLRLDILLMLIDVELGRGQ